MCNIEDLLQADIIIAQRQYDKSVAENMLYEAMRHGKPVIYEADDNFHAVLPSSPVFGIYHQGSEACKMVHQIISRCTGITVSTNELAGDYSDFNYNMEVLPNSIDYQIRDWKTRPLDKDEDHIVVGWSGGCFTPDTEILTENGFKLFKDLDKTEKVATLNRETNSLEYQKPTAYTIAPFKGKLNVVEKDFVNYSVTPNHRMYVAKRNDKLSKKNLSYEIVASEDLTKGNTRFYTKKNCNWSGISREKFIIKGCENSRYSRDKENLEFLTEDWVKFFGFWIAEGWTSNDGTYQVGLSQTKDNGVLMEIVSMMNRYGIHATTSKKGEQIVLTNKRLWIYLNQFGKSNEKFLPKEILELDSQSLSILLKYYLIGDGTSDYSVGSIKPRLRGYTVSKRLADNLVEVALKIGWSANVKNRGKRNSSINGKEVFANHDCYTISFLRNDGPYNYLNTSVDPKDIKEVDYDGLVYCVTVPNTIIYCRRNGVCSWFGNSTHYEDLQLLKPIIPRLLKNYPKVKFGLYTSEQLAKIALEEWEIDPERIQFISPRSFHDYPGGLAYFDIGLAPTKNCRFNSAKSNLKVLEYGAWGIPSVTSNIPPYATTIRNSVNGFHHLTYDNVAFLVENEEKRKAMGEKMKQIVETEFNMDINCHLWPQAWERIIQNSKKNISRKYFNAWGRTGRNDKCPCGCGKKYKFCETYNCWGG